MATSPMPRLEQHLAGIAQRFGLAAIYAFGSRAQEVAGRARGTGLPAASSDVDIGVQPLPGRGLSARDRVRLATQLEELLGTARVDLVVLSEAEPFLALNVIQGELLYCLDPDAQAEEELYILRRAGDLAPYERERRRLILGLGR